MTSKNTNLSAEEYFQQGDLIGALSAAANNVKSSPNNEEDRIFFIELLCINNEFERADSQLKTLMTLNPDLGLAVSTWRQLVHAAQQRVDVFSLNAKPELIDEPTESIRIALELLVALDETNQKRVAELFNQIDDKKAGNEFVINNQSPSLLRDLDDITANIIEVLGTNGKYFWIDIEQIVEIELLKPERILDVLWRRASIVLSNGTEGEVFIPAIYPTLDDSEAALGRKTEWKEQLGLYRGIGLRSWLAGENELSINDHESLKLINCFQMTKDNRVAEN